MQNLGLIGLAIILLATIRWFWRAWAVNVPKPYLFQCLLTSGIILGGIALYLGHADPFAPWAVGVGLVFIYLTATGAQKLGVEAIGVGDNLPVFTAPDDHGIAFNSANLAGSRLLIKFFRGHW